MNHPFSLLLIKTRKEKGLTQTELARLLDIPQSTIARYETGENLPTARSRFKIARAMDLPENFFEDVSKSLKRKRDDIMDRLADAVGTFTSKEKEMLLDLIDAIEKRKQFEKMKRKVKDVFK